MELYVSRTEPEPRHVRLLRYKSFPGLLQAPAEEGDVGREKVDLVSQGTHIRFGRIGHPCDCKCGKRGRAERRGDLGVDHRERVLELEFGGGQLERRR